MATARHVATRARRGGVWGGGWPDELRGEPSAPARAICSACLVQSECLEAGLGELEGLWGGTSPMERRRLRVERGELVVGVHRVA